MKSISHRNHIDAIIPDVIKNFLTRRFDQLADETDVPPVIILVEPDDDISGADFAFLGNNGLLSDIYEQAEPGDPAFVRPYEWVSYWPDLEYFEILYLQDPDNGFWILLPQERVYSDPLLKWVILDESQGGISPVQPL